MRRLLSILLAAMLLIVTAVPTASAADARCGGRPGVYLYEHSNYNRDILGAAIAFCGGYLPLWGFSDPDLSNNTNNLSFGANWNDRASSIQVFNFPRGASIKFYEHKNYNPNGGLLITVTPGDDGIENIPNLDRFWEQQGGFGDRISSLKSFYP